MAFKRADIRNVLGENYSDEIANKLIALHVGVVDAMKDEAETLKAERDKYKAEAEKLPGVQKELDDIKGGEDFKAKYEKERDDFAAYKKQVAQEAETEKIKAAYRKLLIDEKINEKRLDAVMRTTDFSKMKLDKDGNLADVDGLKKTIDDEWAEFKVKTTERGAKVDNPPETDNGGKPTSRAAELAAKFHQEKYGVRSDKQ